MYEASSFIRGSDVSKNKVNKPGHPRPVRKRGFVSISRPAANHFHPRLKHLQAQDHQRRVNVSRNVRGSAG